MDDRTGSLAMAALRELWDAGCPIPSPASQGRLLELGFRRWRSFNRRTNLRNPTRDDRIRDLTKGLSTLEPDPELVGPLIEDYRCVATALAAVLDPIETPQTAVHVSQVRSKPRPRWRRPLEPEAALALWDDFPVDADPRPIVLTGPPGRLPFFPTMENKLASAAAPVVSEVKLPPGVLENLQPQTSPRWQGAPIRVLSAERVLADFPTDRGNRRLPAYSLEIEIENALGRGIVLDPAIEATTWWPAALDPDIHRFDNGFPAYLAPDGRSVEIVLFAGSRVHTLESPTAVLITEPEPYAPPGPAAPEAVDLAGRGRPVTVHLSSPLGPRVLLAPTIAYPLTVLPSSDRPYLLLGVRQP